MEKGEVRQSKRVCVGWLLILFAVAGGIFTGQTCWAIGNITVGQVEVHPYFQVKGMYDDNIFLDHDNEEEDFITVLTPGLQLRRSYEEHLFSLEYHADFSFFADNSDEDSVDQFADALIDLNFAGGLSLGLEDHFRKTSGAESAEVTDRIDQKTNTVRTTVGYDFSNRTTVDVGYTRILYDYDDPFIGRDEDELSLVFFYHFLPKTSLLVEYDFGAIDIERTSDDVDYHQIRAGVRGEITPKLTSLIKVGGQRREYDEPARDDFSTLTFYAALKERFSDRTVLDLIFHRAPNESISFAANAFTSSRYEAKLRRTITPKLTLLLTASFEELDFEEETLHQGAFKKRNDDIWRATAGLEYAIQDWLNLTLNYEHQDDDSNFIENDYEVNRVLIALKATF